LNYPTQPGMEEIFRSQSETLVRQLAMLCAVRLKVEAKEQILLSKTINLTRFIRLASLDHLKDVPEMVNARRVLAMITPSPDMMKPGFTMDTFSLLDQSSLLKGRQN